MTSQVNVPSKSDTKRSRLIHGDCLLVLPTLEADDIDACVTDPPYHLTSINKRYATAESMATNHPVYRRNATAIRR